MTPSTNSKMQYITEPYRMYGYGYGYGALCGIQNTVYEIENQEQSKRQTEYTKQKSTIQFEI